MNNITKKHEREYNEQKDRVAEHWYAISCVPVQHLTHELCVIAVKQCWLALTLGFIPDRHRSAILCQIAVDQDGRALRDVPDEHKTFTRCWQAVGHDGRAFAFVPKKHKTAEMCELAMKNIDNFERVPDVHKTSAMCIRAMKAHIVYLVGLSEQCRTEEVCVAALEISEFNIQHVPDKILTMRMCFSAIKRNGKVLEHVPVRFRTFMMCMFAVVENSGALEFVPSTHRTHAMFMVARIRCEGGAWLFAHESRSPNSTEPHDESRHIPYLLCMADLIDPDNDWTEEEKRDLVASQNKHIFLQTTPAEKNKLLFSMFLLGEHKRAGVCDDGKSHIGMLCDDVLWLIHGFLNV